MTQLELPPISLARYFELLKRRRWQVLPMTIVGLLVGGVIAWLIPRYYVAKTVVTYTGRPLDASADAERDPILNLVRGAQYSVLDTVPTALEELQWIGSIEEAPERIELIDEVRERTTVVSYPIVRGSTEYVVEITYLDPVGERASQFANKLRDAWIARVVGDFETRAGLQMREARSVAAAHQRAVHEALTEIAQHRSHYGIDRDEDQASAQSRLADALALERTTARSLAAEIAGLSAEIRELQDGLDSGVPPRKRQRIEPIDSDSKLSQEIIELINQVVYLKLAYEGSGPSHPNRATYKAMYDRAVANARQVMPGGIASKTLTIEELNPEYDLVEKSIREKKNLLAVKQQQLVTRQDSVADLNGEIARQQPIWEAYDRLQTKLGTLRELWLKAEEHARHLEAVYNRARTDGSVFSRVTAAAVPQAPTEPNITIVALLGSLFGLAVAIGLVLLLDMLRSTFKTVEDVSYGLKLPVLGVMSHLETEEVREQISHQRRMVTLVAVVAVVLVLSIITIYYIAPTRLPTGMLRILDAILGGEGAE